MINLYYGALPEKIQCATIKCILVRISNCTRETIFRINCFWVEQQKVFTPELTETTFKE